MREISKSTITQAMSIKKENPFPPRSTACNEKRLKKKEINYYGVLQTLSFIFPLLEICLYMLLFPKFISWEFCLRPWKALAISYSHETYVSLYLFKPLKSFINTPGIYAILFGYKYAIHYKGFLQRLIMYNKVKVMLPIVGIL